MEKSGGSHTSIQIKIMKKTVIAPRNIHFQILNHYRKQDPFCDIKIYTLKDLEREIYPSFNIDSLLFLMKKHHFSYEISKMYFEVLPFIVSGTNDKRIDELNEIKKELLNAGYIHEPTPDEEFKNLNVDVIGYSRNNNELSRAMNLLGIKPTYIYNDKTIIEEKVNVFTKIEDEVYYTLNSVALLVDGGVNINNVYILRRNNEYDYYLKKFAPSFGFNLNIDEKISYYSTGAFKEFKKIYQKEKDIEKSLELLKEIMKEDEMYEEIKIKILENVVEDLDFELQYDYLCSRLKEQCLINPKFDKAVSVINYPIISEDKYVFVMGFTQGYFPMKVRSNPLLDNAQNDLLGILNSKNKIKEDQDIFINFMKSKNVIIYSYCINDNSSSFYPSPIIKIMGMEEVKPTFHNVFYSEKVLKYIFNDLLDNKRLYKEQPELYFKILDKINVDYLTYDNQIKYAPNVYEKNRILSLSYTQLDKYYGCPFEYYMDYVMKLEPFESNFYSELGNIAHHLIENKNKEGFDFNAEFAREIEKSGEKYPFDEREKFLLNGTIKKQLENAIEAIRLRESFYNKKRDEGHIYKTTNVMIYPEEPLKVELDPYTFIEGRIDNLSVIDDKYFVCIDYKTNSSSSFDPKDLPRGKSTQLPTYIYLVSNSSKFADLIPAGVYINNLLSSKAFPEKEEDLHIYKHLKLNGKTLQDEEFVFSFDQSIAQGGSSFISQLKYSEKGLSGATLIGEETFEEYKNIVEDLFKEMADSLRSNKFDIHPRFINDRKNECDFCRYHDICYVRKNQFNLPPKKDSEEVEE